MSTYVGCLPCQRTEKETKEQLSWCVECAELICKDCADLHVRFKSLCEHTLFEVTEKEASETVASIMPQNCETHPQEPICYFCEDHKAMCCKMCVILNHGKCKDKKNTDDLGRNVKNESEDILQWIQGLEQKIRWLHLNLNNNLKDIEDANVAILAEMKEMRNKIDNIIDTFEQKVIEKFDKKRKEIVDHISVNIEAINETESEARRLASVLAVNKYKGTNTQFLLASNEVKKRRTDCDAKSNKLISDGGETLEWKLKHGNIFSEIETVLAKLNVEIKGKKKPFQTMSESNTAIIEREQDKTPLFVGVEMFTDGRLLVFDQSQAILRLLASDQKQTCQIFIRDAKQFAAINKDFITVCLNESKMLRFFKLAGTKITLNGELQINSKCLSLSKYRHTAILLCATNENEDNVKLKLLSDDRTLVDFSFPVMVKISPWRGFVYDAHSDRFIAVSKDGLSLIWLGKSGQRIKEKRFDNVGRGGLSGLAVDNDGRVYTAATRKIFEVGKTGIISGTFTANINVYSITVSETGDKLIAVGHSAAIEVFKLMRSD